MASNWQSCRERKRITLEAILLTRGRRLEDLLERARSSDVIILDARPANEYDAGYIAGAISVPIDELQDRLRTQFTLQKAAGEMKRYREKGPGPTTRLLRDGLVDAGLLEGTLLDVGGGVGALSFDLLDRGVARAVVVDASAAYLAVASEEAARRGRSPIFPQA
jgi:2-polyprenyl-3-methyl-5-hydroxy-6-metoxy-1,4-benzoquinol methylase